MVETEEYEQNKHKGLIRFLTYQPGCRSVGQALLEESEKYLRDLGMDEIRAFRITYAHDDYSYRFYHLGFGLVSDKTMHIYALFRMNGYEINSTRQGEIFMDQPEYSVAEPALPDNQVEIAVEQQPGRGALPGLTVQVKLGFVNLYLLANIVRRAKSRIGFLSNGLALRMRNAAKVGDVICYKKTCGKCGKSVIRTLLSAPI